MVGVRSLGTALARLRTTPLGLAALLVTAAEGVAFAQQPPVCVPGTQVCAQGNGNGGVQGGGSVKGQVGPNGVSGDASANGNANGNAEGQGQGGGGGGGHHHRRSSSGPTRYGTGVTFCGTFKAGVLSGYKVGPCFAVSFRTERLFFEIETQLLFGGTRHSIDWVFPMSFVIPLTSERSMFEGLQLRAGGSPVGVTWAKTEDGGNYLRFGLHAGLTYELLLGSAVAWRVLDARAFLDFGTRRQVDRLGNFLDFGGQLSTGIVF